MNTTTPFHLKPLLLLIAALATLVAAASLSGAMMKPPPQIVPILIWTPILACMAAYWLKPNARAYALAIPLPLVVIVQCIRAPIGVWFLVQGSTGALPQSLASLAGWGDLAYGLASIVLLITWKVASRSRALLAVWNLAGLMEILAVNVTAMRLLLFSSEGESMRKVMTSFPVVWIPLLLVPCVIGGHFLFFARLKAWERS
tara:strand:+ start:59406 stop:60008 length:603 start_codon:yes stop_codon:yes gene_type:complete